MEIESQYVSPDELKEIAYQIKPSKVLLFCRVNRLMKSICDNDSFWKNYIGDDQEKYEKLVRTLAKQGNLKLFKRLWGNGAARQKEIVSEPRLLYPLFEIAYSNGHEEFADYVLDLLLTWLDYIRKLYANDDIHLLGDIPSIMMNGISQFILEIT